MITPPFDFILSGGYSAFLGDLEQKQQQWNNALAMYQLLGYNAPQEYLDILGIQKPVNTGYVETSGRKWKKEPDTGDTGEVYLDMNSVLDLGKGPIICVWEI